MANIIGGTLQSTVPLEEGRLHKLVEIRTKLHLIYCDYEDFSFSEFNGTVEDLIWSFVVCWNGKPIRNKTLPPIFNKDVIAIVDVMVPGKTITLAKFAVIICKDFIVKTDERGCIKTIEPREKGN